MKSDVSKAARKKPLHPKHVPQRTCIACRQKRAKRELVRVVRTPAGDVEVDLRGKKSGRGAYLCPEKSCWEIGLRKNLEYALKVKITPEDKAELLEYGETLPAGSVEHG